MRSLQNTKFSIDEKLDKGDISIFGRKPLISSESQNDAKDDHKAARKMHEESDAGASEESEFSDIDEASSNEESDGSDEEYADASKQPANPKDQLKQQVELHGGRLRRKVVFEDGIEDGDMEVI